MLSQKETNLPTIDYQGRTVSFEKARWWQLKYSLNFHPYLQKMSILTILQGTNISPKNGMFEDDFPFPKVGYVNPLEGNIFQRGWFNHQPEWSILGPSFRNGQPAEAALQPLVPLEIHPLRNRQSPSLKPELLQIPGRKKNDKTQEKSFLPNRKVRF